MNYRRLGNSDLLVSEIGFGCMSLGESTSQNRVLIHSAIDSGINFFDTADLYQKGLNEESLGIAIREKRAALIIASKVGNVWNSQGTGLSWNPRKSHILSAIELSLQRLKTDYLDLYQLHGGTIEDPIDEAIEAFEKLKQQGKIRHYGISSIRPNVIRRYLESSAIISVMMQYSLLDRRPAEWFSMLAEKQVSILARGSLGGGLLIDKPSLPYLNYTASQIAAAKMAISDLSSDYRTAGQTAIKYVLSSSLVASAVVGIRTNPQLVEAVSSSGAPALKDEELDRLNQTIAPNQYTDHR